jgi:hypothetical protein
MPFACASRLGGDRYSQAHHQAGGENAWRVGRESTLTPSAPNDECRRGVALPLRTRRSGTDDKTGNRLRLSHHLRFVGSPTSMSWKHDNRRR